MTIQEMKIRKKELHLTCREIAEMAQVPQATVQKILGGITKSPRHETMLKLEKVLGAVREKESKEKEYGINGSSMTVREPSAAYGERKRGTYTGRYAGNFPFLSGKGQGEYTVEDIERLPEYVRVELIDGVLYDMADPTENHQTLVVELCSEIRNYLKKKGFPCRVLPGPYSVRPRLNSNKTNVSPDISVICDKEKRNPQGCVGAPDWIIEILSPSNPGHDFVRKLNLYAETGVREYWIVDPIQRMVYVFPLEKEGVKAREYTFQDKVPAGIYEDLEIDFSEIEPLLWL